MGYSTYFDGSLEFNKPVGEQLKEYINRFSSTRRMERDVEKIKEIHPNWKELCFFGDLGENGEYFAPISERYGQERDDDSIIDYNSSGIQPGLWCQWIITDESELEWDGGEKFYNYIEWLEYLIENFFEPLGYKLNGVISWEGEETGDVGEIIVEDNKVTIKYYDNLVLEKLSDEQLINELVSRGYAVSK